MQSLTEKFNELRQHLKGGVSSMKHTGFDPVYYLVFPAEEMLQAKQALPQILAQLKLDGFHPRILSMTSVLNEWFRGHKLRKAWQTGLQSSDNDRTQFKTTFSNKLEKEHVIVDAIHKNLDELKSDPHGLLWVTDLEALHRAARREDDGDHDRPFALGRFRGHRGRARLGPQPAA
jgi:hypothetical protein